MKKLKIEQGGHPLMADDLMTIQDFADKGINALAKSFTDAGNMILYGIVDSIDGVSAGAMLVDGEILLFDGYERLADESVYLQIKEDVVERDYASGLRHPVTVNKYLVASTESGMGIYDLPRFTRVESIENFTIEGADGGVTDLAVNRVGDIVTISGVVQTTSPESVKIIDLPSSGATPLLFNSYAISLIDGEHFPVVLSLLNGVLSYRAGAVSNDVRRHGYLQVNITYKVK